MATVTPTLTFNRAETDRRVRHPLHALRGYIRRYVILEGAAIAIIYLALLFWLGLLFDFGLFKVTGGFDWIQELQGVAEGQSADMVVRGVLLGMAVAGLLAVVALKVLFRLFREFSDPALALVLERRFPKELGDRVITAVELADPKMAVHYGYSQALVDKTINEAADRVEKVPVREVFNWARLKKLGLLALGLTLGLYLVTGAGYLGISAALGDAVAPMDYVYRSAHTGSIWVERNVLLMDSYWPRQAYLELVRFQTTPDHPNEMRIGRDEQRPDLQVRAFQWVVADRTDPRTTGGWRPLLWKDLPEFVSADLINAVAIPEDWHGWIIDLDDLDPKLPVNAPPSRWQGMTSGAIRKDMANPAVVAALARAGVDQGVRDLLNWKTWPLDKIDLQHKNSEVRHRMRLDFPRVHKALEDLFARINELGRSSALERRLRALDVPDSEEIQFTYWGKKTKNSIPPELGRTKDNNFYFSLADLKESVRFTIQAADFSTPMKRIELVPPPSIASLTLDKEEPAYIYYRMQGDQAPLKGKKQIFKDVPVSITGESSVIQVPIGTSLVLRAKADRPLKDPIRMKRPEQSEERGALIPDAPVQVADDRQTFSVAMPNVTRPIEFNFEFIDRDNVRGKRRILVRPVDDRAPEVFDVEMTAVLRKPKFRAEAGKGAQAAGADGFLITPDALIPFKGTLRDDYGLTQADWQYEVEPIEFELIGRPLSAKDKDNLPSLVLQGNTRIRRNGLIVSGLQFLPGPSSPGAILPAYWAWIGEALTNDLAYSSKRISKEANVPLERFQMRLEERSVDELTLNALEQRLKQPPPQRGLFKEHLLKEEDGFDFKRYLNVLKAKETNKEPQLHYRVRLSVSATDNNIETGPSIGRNKAPFTYLVVSETELLAQIFLEEELLRERLEKVVYKLKNARTFANEQVSKISIPDFDLGLVAIRVDEVRKLLSDTASSTREIHGDYARILRELEINRVGWDRGKRKIEDVKTKIVEPLEEVVNPNNGSFDLADRAVSKLFEELDVDLSRLREAEGNKALLESSKQKLDANRPNHVKNTQDLRDRLDTLLERLNSVLLAMDEGIAFGKLLEIIVTLEREQRQAHELIRRFQRQQEAELIKGVLNPGSK